MLSTYSSTFYIIDINRPTRFQTTLELELEKKEYTPRELCKKLDTSRQGKYKKHQSFPPIFFFSFAKKELKPATSVKMCDFPIRKEETTLQNILPPLRESLRESVVAVHINWIGLPWDKVSKLRELRDLLAKAENDCFGEVRPESVVAVHINWIGLPWDKVSKLRELRDLLAKAENDCFGEVITVLDDVLSCCDVSKLVNVPELAVNKFMVNELQHHELFSDFVIKSQGTDSVAKEEQLCRSSSSMEDLLLYHSTRYVHNEEGVTGAVISTPSFNHDDKDDDDIIVEGSADSVRNHRPQLIASMEKVAAELAYKAAKSGNIFSKIVIYGLLVDITTGNTTVGKLIMNFLEAKSTITWSRDTLHLNACLWRLRQVLSSSNA